MPRDHRRPNVVCCSARLWFSRCSVRRPCFLDTVRRDPMGFDLTCVDHKRRQVGCFTRQRFERYAQTHLPPTNASSGCRASWPGHIPAAHQTSDSPAECKMMPDRTRRSSTRSTPRGLFGSKELIVLNCSSVNPKFKDIKPPRSHILNHITVYSV